ncbi:MAG: hypothetical protein Q4C03_05345 [bacterium]|nr:hypothetical protein [bacterium]MDO4730999.1 hypothetical protein [Clostridia bacterium]
MVIETLAERFPQLYLKPGTGVSKSDLYRSIIRKGYRYEGDLSHFTGTVRDSLTLEQTPAGNVMIVFLAERADFECFYRIMACRCEPVDVPVTMGACCISGINDWSKIFAHMAAYRESGGDDSSGEFARFTATPLNYKETMILLSDGPYSAVLAKYTPYDSQTWRCISLEIRKYHELTHFICRNLFPKKKYPIWDELLADCMGLLFATGEYSIQLAQAFLGIENGVYIGGRLENYTDGLPSDETVNRVMVAIDKLSHCCNVERSKGNEGYVMLEKIESRAEEICPELTNMFF